MGLLATDENNVIDYGANKKFPIEYSVKNKFLVLRAEVNANHEPNIKKFRNSSEKRVLRKFQIFHVFTQSFCSKCMWPNVYMKSVHHCHIFIYRVKALQTQLAEKDAMIRVFQRSPMMRSSSVHTLSCSPQHSPRPSMTSSLSRQFDMPSSIYATIRHNKTGNYLTWHI